MKTHNLLVLLFISVMFIAACKDDETGSPRQVTKSYTYNQIIRGSEGVRGELPLADLRLDNILGVDTINSLTSAQLQLADSYLELSGLDQVAASDTVPVVLEDFTITVGSQQSYMLGNFSTNPQGVDELGTNIQYSTNEVVEIIKSIFSATTSGSRRAPISVSFTPNVDITTADNVQLIIHFGGIYHFVVDE